MSRRHAALHAAGAGARAESLRPYRHLAVRVIAEALRDVLTHTRSNGDRESARRFLAGSRMLNHWCQLAEIDAGAVRTLLQDLGRPEACHRAAGADVRPTGLLATIQVSHDRRWR